VRQRLLTTTDSIILVRHGYNNPDVLCRVRSNSYFIWTPVHLVTPQGVLTIRKASVWHCFAQGRNASTSLVSSFTSAAGSIPYRQRNDDQHRSSDQPNPGEKTWRRFLCDGLFDLHARIILHLLQELVHLWERRIRTCQAHSPDGRDSPHGSTV
jgi:hypothetical protein